MITLTTPALLFPAISLLLLAYTNRFLVVAQLIRSLSGSMDDTNRRTVHRQITTLKHRLHLIKVMQIFGVAAFLLCTVAMFSIFMNQPKWGSWLFGVSLLSLSISLVYSLWEISISTQALNVILDDLHLYEGEKLAREEQQ